MTKLSNLIWIPLFLIPFFVLSCSGTADERAPLRPDRDFVKQGTNTSRLRGTVQTICAEDVEIYVDYIYVADGPGGI